MCLAFVPNNEDNPMLWSDSKRIIWDDFKGNPDQNTNAVAITASGMSYDFTAKIENDVVKVDCRIGAYFYPYESWFKPSLASEYTLEHERLHFDISELMARKFRKRLQTEHFTKDVKKEMRAIYHEMANSLDSLQNAYDTETNYSINKEQQAVWHLKIAKELETSGEYK